MGNTLTHSKKENQIPEIHTPGTTGAGACRGAGCDADSMCDPNASIQSPACPMSPGEEAAAYADLENLKTPNPSPNVSVWQNATDTETPGTGRISNNSAHIMSLIDPRSPANEDISRTPILVNDGKDGQPKDLKGLRKKLVTQQAGLVGNPPTPSATASTAVAEPLTSNENAAPAPVADPTKED